MTIEQQIDEASELLGEVALQGRTLTQNEALEIAGLLAMIKAAVTAEVVTDD